MNDARRLDDVDRHLISLLQTDGRMPNNALAAAVDIAPSTCVNRMRNLREIGAIRGVHADIDPQWLGRPIQAMVAVKIRSDSRPRMGDFSDALVGHPAVLNIYFVAGVDDFLVHVSMADTQELRLFILEELSSKGFVASTETKLIFEHTRNGGRSR